MKLKKLHEDALNIFNAGIKAVDPANAVKRYLTRQDDRLEIQGQTYDLSNYENIYVIGMGKASAAMAQAVEELIGDRLKAGVLNVKYGHTVPLKIVRVNEAGHPVPDEAGLSGTRQIIDMLRQTDEKDKAADFQNRRS
jgi:glycerate 2-kinase